MFLHNRIPILKKRDFIRLLTECFIEINAIILIKVPIRPDVDKIQGTGSYNLFTSRVYLIICERWEINCRAKC